MRPAGREKPRPSETAIIHGSKSVMTCVASFDDFISLFSTFSELKERGLLLLLALARFFLLELLYVIV